MQIGIVVSSSLNNRTGVEEYIYQLLKHLPAVDDYKNHQFFLYSRKNLRWPFKFGWTQIRLSWEMLKNSMRIARLRPLGFGNANAPMRISTNKLDVLFVPAHTYPIIHPKLVVVIQGLEFEAVPKTYNFLKRKILRFLTKRNAKRAEKIIVPSQTTKNDLIKFYKINPNKIFVIHHGIDKNQKSKIKIQNYHKYILYLGSGHKRKNIEGLKKAFKILKDKYKIPHKLLLAGIESYVREQEKWQLLKNANIFVYPSFYEGFGMPVLEAQKADVPVVASNTSSFPEILGDSALLVNPNNPEEIVEAIYKIIREPNLKQNLIKKGQENVRRFSWLKCARETLKVIISNL